MTLIIACLLLYQGNYDWPWYVGVAFAWLMHLDYHDASTILKKMLKEYNRAN